MSLFRDWEGEAQALDLIRQPKVKRRGGDLLANHCNGQFRADDK